MDLRIQNFRGLADLTLHDLRRLNILVGPNGVGKTTALEAAILCAKRGSPYELAQLLLARGEVAPPGVDERGLLGLDRSLTVRSLVRSGEGEARITLGDTSVALSFGAVKDVEQAGLARVMVTEADDSQADPALFIDTGDGRRRIVRYPISGRRLQRFPKEDNVFAAIYIPSGGADDEAVAGWWTQASLRVQDPLEGLHVVAPDVRRVSAELVGDMGGYARFLVRVEGLDEPVPLERLGEGASRAFGLSMAMVEARGGWLFVDEIENGIYFERQPALWDFLLRAAKALDVRLLATTHSRDTLEGFSAALVGAPEEGAIYQLDGRAASLRALRVDPPGVKAAIEQGVEVR